MEKRPVQLKAPARFVWSDLRRGPDTSGGGAVSDVDFSAMIRQLHRRRRTIGSGPRTRANLELMGRLTWISFRLEGLEVREDEVIEALVRSGLRGEMRPRQAQRIRSHVALLLHIEASLDRRRPLKVEDVLRWYTTISGGLSTSALTSSAMQRLDQVCRQINSPPMRLQAALAEISGLYERLLEDPLVPSFNGIMARLLLRYHLGRCGLPYVEFDPTLDRPSVLDRRRLQARLVALVARQLAAG